jgi:hypothetical protein
MKKGLILVLALCLAGAAFGDMWIAPMGTGTFVPDPVSNSRVISFSNGIAFDTRQGEPALPAGYRSAASGVYLVQFSGPIQEAWVDALWSAGALVYSYIPNYAFTARMDGKALAAVKAMAPVVWVGEYHPAYKVCEPSLFSAKGQGSVVMMLYPDADIEAAAVKVQNLGGVLKERTISYIAKVLRADIDLANVVDLANLPEAMVLHTWSGPPTLANTQDQWVCQQGWLATAPPASDLTSRPIWRRGIRGQGQIVSYHDSGINFNIISGGHCCFRDPLVNITTGGDYVTHRKVVAYKVYETSAFGECAGYHGTHVGGTLAGNDTIGNGAGRDTVDGMAKDARINFTDILDADCHLHLPTDLTSLWDTVARSNSAGPVKQHSGSWRYPNSSGTYLLQDASTDAWHWINKLVLCIMAAGNEYGPRLKVGNPSLGKNVLTIGATFNSTQCNDMPSFSSRGPAQDGRIKPTISAPGSHPGIYSSDGFLACGYKTVQGTSMATPAANGALVLVRQYFHKGWYPNGRPRAADSLDPSAALMRAMAICSADSMGTTVVPDSNSGFGRLDLDSVLYFDTLGTDDRKLAVIDNRTGYTTGQYVQYAVNVTDSTLPLRVALAWVDTAAAPNANPTLVNDLNLELQNPAGVTYRGNQMAGWRSTPNPAAWDNRNVEEIARIVSPRRGTWLIRVRFNNAPQGARVWFGLVVTGGLATGISGVGGEQIVEGTKVSKFLLGKAVPNPTTGETRLDYSLPVNGQVSLGIYNTTGQLVREMVRGSVLAGHWAVTWDGRDASGQKVPGGVYFYQLVVDGGQTFSATKKVVLLK